MSIQARLEMLRESMEQRGLSAVLVSNKENRRYFSGFTGSAGDLLVSATQAILITDFRYVEQAEHQSPEFRIERATGGGWLPKLVQEIGAIRVGFESEHTTVARYALMEQSISEINVGGKKASLVEVPGLFERMRGTKDKEEVELLARAIEITDQALEQVAPEIEPGVTELEIAWELEKAMRELGAETLAFETIVGAGPNGALPHHQPDETVVRERDTVVIDMGAQYHGYCADLTRTFLMGEPDQTFLKVYKKVLEAQLTAEEQIVAGMTGSEVDRIARDLIAEAGYGENFGHSLGHGVGLAVHEYPALGTKSQDVLEDGMVFTVEPGIYISGWGGVRIEDVVILENGRARVLSKAEKLEHVG